MSRRTTPDKMPLWQLILIAIVCGSILAAIILHFFNR
jgi:hypothetical protein